MIIIISIVLVFINLFILANIHMDKKVRERTSSYWHEYPWEPQGRQKISIWIYILALLGLVHPIIAFLLIIATLAFLAKNSGPSSNDGYEKVAYRYYFKNKLLDIKL